MIHKFVKLKILIYNLILPELIAIESIHSKFNWLAGCKSRLISPRQDVQTFCVDSLLTTNERFHWRQTPAHGQDRSLTIV